MRSWLADITVFLPDGEAADFELKIEAENADAAGEKALAGVRENDRWKDAVLNRVTAYEEVS